VQSTPVKKRYQLEGKKKGGGGGRMNA
jgi:hypothetical protein